MKNGVQNYAKLVNQKATRLTPFNFKNDMGQKVSFYEDPQSGDAGQIWAVFEDFKAAFITDFFETDDMTGIVSDLIPVNECLKRGMNPYADLDYTPRLIDGVMLLKYEQ